MNYSEKQLTDLRFTAIRFEAKIDRTCMEELTSSGMIQGFRDLCSGDSFISEIMKNTDLSERTTARLAEILKGQDRIQKAYEEYLKIAEDNDIFVISEDDEHYPWAWKQLSGMPPVFFCRGNAELIDRCYRNGAVSIVGSRDASYYGKQATRDYTEHFVGKGIVTISGMASGIDRMVHTAAINKGGDTIAIMPGGVDVIYPPRNQDVYEAICRKGLVISEVPPGFPVTKQYFPARNRLIAALGDVTLVMEAGKFSGTLHTASFAAAQGKDVFVLPHGIYSTNAIGGMNLIRDGAEMIIDKDTIDDRIAECLVNRLGEADLPGNIEDIRQKADSEPDKLGADEWKALIKDRLTAGPMTFDELTKCMTVDFTKLTVMLAELENAKDISRNEGKYSLTFQR